MILDYFTKIVVAECSQGQQKDGVQYGGLYLCNHLNLYASNIIEHQLFNTMDGYKKTSNILSYYLNQGEKTLLLGGDHSLGISSIDAYINTYKDDLSVLWIDAHGDINDHSTSISGNLHGMPLGYHYESRTDKIYWRENQYRLKSNKLYYFGLRDLDKAEEDLIVDDMIRFSTELDSNLKTFIDNSKYLLISFDVDSLDPEYMSSTGVMANNGLNYTDVRDVITYALQTNKVVHMDIMEFNPYLGDVDESLDTIKKLFKKPDFN